MTLPSITEFTSTRLRLRLRRDLSFHPTRFGGRRYWIIKDPMTLRYFKFRAEEYTILQMLDGSKGLEEIKSEFESVHAPRRMTTQRLQQFVANLHRNSLVLSDGPEQSQQLLKRRSSHRRERVASALSNVLAIRFPGIDPEPLLKWLYPKLSWCFAPWFFVCCLLFALTALALVVAEADELRSRLPDLHTFISVNNLVWLGVVLAVTKVLHEFGHALTCRHFGGECHEMGIMLLVFTPCLYCNVTDSWILSSRWQRIAISAAGILVEAMLASVATFLWWYSRPGPIHAISLNIMVVCAVGTVVLNGNPLLRYDGYFILSDLLEAPNLWQESRSVVRHFLARWLLGVDLQDSVTDDRRGVLALYAVASMLYRLAVTLAILLFLHKALAPAGLQFLAYGVAVIIGVGIVLRVFAKVRRMIEDPLISSRFQQRRSAASLGAIVAVVAGFFLVPFPCRVRAPAMLEPQAAQRMYVSVAGTLVEAVTAGQYVRPGQQVARLDDSELCRSVIRLEGELQRLEQRARNLDSLAARDAEAFQQLPTAREMVAGVKQRLVQHKREVQALTLESPVAGMVFPPPTVPRREETSKQVGRWAGTPLDTRNLGCTLERGTLFCLVGDPTRFEAVLFVDESDIDLVRVGQSVRLRFDSTSGDVLTGKVFEIAGEETKVVPRELAAGRDIANRPDSAGIARPAKASYQARVTLDESSRSLLIGARGQANIVVDSQSASQRLYRLVRRTLMLPL